MTVSLTDASLQTTREWQRSQYVKCYTIGHAWFDYENSDWHPEWGTGFVLRCQRCGSERRDAVDISGGLSHRSYWHPDDYKFAKGTKPTKDEFRLMMIRVQREDRAAGHVHR
jgi:hypothetical protein